MRPSGFGGLFISSVCAIETLTASKKVISIILIINLFMLLSALLFLNVHVFYRFCNEVYSRRIW
jgi:hypothetical protein